MYCAYLDVPGERTDLETLDEFVLRAESFDVFFGLYAPEPVGAVVFDGPFIHAAVAPQVRGRWLPVFQQCLDYGLKHYGQVISRVHPTHHAMRSMIRTLGFTFNGRDDEGFELYTRNAPWAE